MLDYEPTAWTARYHVPRSQVWEGSRGGQRGNVHLHLPIEPRERRTLEAVEGRRVTVTRWNGVALCGRSGWYDRPARTPEVAEEKCPRCVEMAVRYGVEWPALDIAHTAT